MGIRLRSWLRGLALVVLGFSMGPQPALAQVTYTEDFTGSTTTYSWYFTGGACLTAGTVAAGGSQPGPIAGCSSVLNSYYKLQKDGDPTLVGGDQGKVPDTSGALRFTNGETGSTASGHNEAGSIISKFTFPTDQGVSINFKTVTYEGDSGGDGKDGADGISFFLMDACVPLAGGTLPDGCGKVNYGKTNYTALGAIGGSLGYSCSNGNPLADGLVGAYLGLGIDEFGNFLNGASNSLGETDGTNKKANNGTNDNTTTGGYYKPGRIGLRGSGNVNFQMLSNTYQQDPGSDTSATAYYPSAMNTSCPSGSGVYEALTGKCQTCSGGATYDATKHACPSGNIQDHPTYGQIAVQQACGTGQLYNNRGYARGVTPTAAGNLDASNGKNILDYAAIANGFYVLPSKDPIANESATTRRQGTPIVYQLNISQGGKLNFAVSYNGGSWTNVLTNADIKQATGLLPPAFRFGFAGSTGGDVNVHEIMCFQAGPDDLALNSGGVNDFHNPEIVNGTQLFLASYFPKRAWAGSATALNIGFDKKANAISVATTPNWDASCVLTGGTCPSGAPAAANAQSNRVMLTWDSVNNTGVAFESNKINSQQQTAIDGDDPSGSSGVRLDFLRGGRTNELSDPTGKGLKLFRNRISVLGDIIDSSPTLVGPPSTYPANIQWVDLLNSKATQPENSGETYAQFQQRMQTPHARQNVVYVGANDGFLHGFAAGSFDANNNFLNDTTTPNDGHEVLAYMPGAVSMTIHNSGTPALDYSSPQYTHAYYVDATPGTGDVFYGGKWHTWLAGGFGVGGAGLYVLDVTDPSTFSESGPAGTVIVEWTPSSIPGGCGNNSSCGDNMGTISGVPQIRRFHTGQWGFVFGNGLNSASGDAGIFIALLDTSSGKPSLIYLGTSNATKSKPLSPKDGIVAVAAADIDSDHVVDYVYAGDVLGNLWRFDLTGSQTSQWKVSGTSGSGTPAPLFKEPFGNPITTQVTVSTLRTIDTQLGTGAPSVTRKPERIIVNFGTGQQIPQSNDQPAQYSTGQQYLYGIWDGDFYDWNSQKPAPIQPVVSLGQNQYATITSQKSLQSQTISTDPNVATVRHLTKNTVCWADQSGCSQYGWYMPLIGTNEQIIFDPVISPEGELIVNTFIPVPNDPLSCKVDTPTGFTMAMEPDSGASSPNAFFYINSNLNGDGIQLNGTGIPALLMSGQSSDANAEYVLTQTSNGTPSQAVRTNRHVVTVGQRLNWIERR